MALSIGLVVLSVLSPMLAAGPVGAATRAAAGAVPAGPAASASFAAGALPRWPAVHLRRQAEVVYARPVDAPLIDRFRPPATPYGSGNRGWEFATGVGTEVRAAADGTVTFAGPVGGTRAVTVSHADGLRTSYTYLQAAIVEDGDRVRLGDPIGRSGDSLHFGVRRGDTYLDPALLFAPPETRRVRLVPLR